MSQFYEVDYHDMNSTSDTSADENWIDKNVILCSEGGCDTWYKKYMTMYCCSMWKTYILRSSMLYINIWEGVSTGQWWANIIYTHLITPTWYSYIVNLTHAPGSCSLLNFLRDTRLCLRLRLGFRFSLQLSECMYSFRSIFEGRKSTWEQFLLEHVS